MDSQADCSARVVIDRWRQRSPWSRLIAADEQRDRRRSDDSAALSIDDGLIDYEGRADWAFLSTWPLVRVRS